MKRYKGFLIDLDGTMYKGEEKITEAIAFVQQLKKQGYPYLFVTNNSTRTPKQVADKLVKMEIPATEEQVFTTSQATANFIYEQKKDASVYVIGEEGLQSILEERGFRFDEENPDFVVVGLDRKVTYEKLMKACLAVRKGATFISTNGDIALPTERGFLPGSGAIGSVISVSTRTQPIVIGKPESIIMEQAQEVLGLAKSDTLMIGDNYDTDILAGIQAGIDTLLVYTGVTTKEMLPSYEKQPTHVIDSLKDWPL